LLYNIDIIARGLTHMHFIYPDNDPPRGFHRSIKYHDLDATKFWSRHYSNAKYLTFIAQHSDTSTPEKLQAMKELDTADNKMKYWRRHPNFNLKTANRLKEEMDRQWTPPQPTTQRTQTTAKRKSG